MRGKPCLGPTVTEFVYGAELQAIWPRASGVTMTQAAGDIDGRRAWWRLAASLLLGTIGCTGMWSHMVALPNVQADFGVSRSDASIPYMLSMVGFGVGGVLMGRIMDRYGVMVSIFIGIVLMSSGYVVAGFARNLWEYGLAYGLLIGLGTSAMFAPLMADISLWFQKHRGMAVAIASCGNGISGVIWSPLLQGLIAAYGWRTTHIAYGAFALVTLVPLALAFRRRAPQAAGGGPAAAATWQPKPIAVSPRALQVLLMIAGVGCCTAMATPQVHIVAWCGDLGYGPARGAEMLALMLFMSVVSRLAAGVIADRIGAMATLLLGSVMQAIVLLMYLPFNGLVGLYVVSALFGLFMGGIIPMYALIVRDYFPPREAGQRVGMVIMATLIGMAFGGWVTGAIFDATGSYHKAFTHSFGWNLLNVAIISFLVWSGRRARGLAPA